MNAWFPHCLRVAVLITLCCVAASARADDAPVPLTVEEAREAQALFGFDGAIPRIVQKSFQEQPEYLTMTPAQRTCVVGIASPAFQSLFDEAFSQLFGDRATLSEWTAFAATAGGKIFIAQMRKAALLKVSGEAEPDLSATIAAMTDAEQECPHFRFESSLARTAEIVSQPGFFRRSRAGGAGAHQSRMRHRAGQAVKTANTRGLRAVVRRLRWPLALAGLLALYPVLVLTTVYVSTARSDFPGGRHGPRDAYRHSLASAIVAYTGSPRWVDWVTGVMEKGGQGDRARAMDAHNNLLGARIGARAESWSGMRAAVSAAVRTGGVDQREADRITWLPSTDWQERAY